jgi:transposase
MGLSLLIKSQFIKIKRRERLSPLPWLLPKSSLWLLPSIAISSDRATIIINKNRENSTRIGKKKRFSMEFYQCKHEFVCGVDLHSKMMYICIMNRKQEILVHKPIKNKNLVEFKKALEPYRGKILVVSEACFPYYWLYDFLAKIKVDFQLGHPFYMDLIHKGKVKNDKLDSKKIAKLTLNDSLPPAHACSKGIRSLRDLARRRSSFVQDRSALMTHIKIQGYQSNIDDIGKITKVKIRENKIAPIFKDEDLRVNVELNLNTIDFLNEKIDNLEKYIVSRMNQLFFKNFTLLKSIKGIGDIIAQTILLEIDDINRFPNHKSFASYCRVVKCSHDSAGKKLGYGNPKIGNPYLRNAFGEAAVKMAHFNPSIKKFFNKLELKHGTGKAYAILSHKISRSIYHMLKKGVEFDIKLFLR